MYGWITERVVDHPPGFVYFIVLFLKEYIALGIDEAVGPPRFGGLEHERGYVAGTRRDTFDFFDVIGERAFARHDVVPEYFPVGSPVEGIFAVDWEKVVRPLGTCAGEAVKLFPVYESGILFVEVVFIGHETIVGGGVEEVFQPVPHDVVRRRYRIGIDSCARTGDGVGAEDAHLLVGLGCRYDVSVGEQLG